MGRPKTQPSELELGQRIDRRRIAVAPALRDVGAQLGQLVERLAGQRAQGQQVAAGGLIAYAEATAARRIQRNRNGSQRKSTRANGTATAIRATMIAIVSTTSCC